ncbi:MAG: BamA/TamA family outer membrane protein [bacterium]|nr:BamA/TamA family outer membrane protein [bacterium]
MMRTIIPTLILLFLFAFPVHGRGNGSALADHAGENIALVEISGAIVTSREMEALIPAAAGEPFSPGKVRDGVLNLFRTGLYERVDVRVLPADDGVVLRYEVVPRRWLEDVEFIGNLALSDGELIRKVNFRKNEEITEERLVENAVRIKEYYGFRGYPETEIAFRVVAGRENRTRVIFEVKEGNALYISQIALTGDPGFSRMKLLAIIASAPGGKVDGEMVKSDLKKIRDNLRDRFYLDSQITYSLKPAHDFPDSVELTFDVNRGPVTALSVQLDDPDESMRVERRMKKVFLASDSTEKAKAALTDELTSKYRSQGYPFASLSWVEDRSDTSVRTLTLSVDRGLRTFIGGIEVEGVRFLPDDRLHSALGLDRGAPFVKTELDGGVRSLLREYRFEGFVAVQAEVKPLNFMVLNGHQEVLIRIVLEEGERVILKQLKVNGGPYGEEKAKGFAAVAEGKGYVPELVGRGREALLQRLGADGYLYAAVSVTEPVEAGEGTVEVTLNVEEGPRVKLGSVIITGNENVSPRIIRLALDLKRGKVITRDEILKAQKRIYELGVMGSVDVQLADPDVPQEYKDLLVTVKERPRYVVGFRLGYGSEDKLRASASLTYRNLGNMARKLTLIEKASDIERAATLRYSHPWFVSKPIDLTLSLSDVLEKRESYTQDSLSIAADFVREMSEITEARLGYSYESLKLRNVSPDAQLSTDDAGKITVAAVAGEIIYDDRDDFLDPWSGLLGDLLLEVAATGLGSEAEFAKLEIALHRYLPLGSGIVLAGLLRTGGVLAYRRSEDVIISKRFFLGGQNSVRGYRLDSLGPRDNDGNPVGGNYMLNANLEFRFGFYKTVRGVIFLDSGSVWLDKRSTIGEADFALRYAGGAGLRWSSPIGPLSLDYGYKLNPVVEDEHDRYRWHFSIGHAF